MGTRSVVAVPFEDSWRGRYCHWDGYPEGVGKALHIIVKRVGLDVARRVLTEEHYGWSSVDSEQEQSLAWREPDRFEPVPGYGVAYTHAEQPDRWITPEGDDSGTEWAYVLRDDEIEVFERVWNDDAEHMTGMFGMGGGDRASWARRAAVPYDELWPVDFEDYAVSDASRRAG